MAKSTLHEIIEDRMKERDHLLDACRRALRWIDKGSNDFDYVENAIQTVQKRIDIEADIVMKKREVLKKKLDKMKPSQFRYLNLD